MKMLAFVFLIAGCASNQLLVLNVRESARLAGCSMQGKVDSLTVGAVTDSLIAEMAIGFAEGLKDHCK